LYLEKSLHIGIVGWGGNEIWAVDSQEKSINIVAKRCQILRLKCTKIDFNWGPVPDPARGAYSAS